MGIVTGMGWLFSGVLKFVPGVPTFAVYALAIVAVVGLPAGYGYHKGSDGRTAAVVSAKADCRAKIDQIELDAEKATSAVLERVQEMDANVVEPENQAEIDDLCKKSKLCRKEAPNE